MSEASPFLPLTPNTLQHQPPEQRLHKLVQGGFGGQEAQAKVDIAKTNHNEYLSHVVAGFEMTGSATLVESGDEHPTAVSLDGSTTGLLEQLQLPVPTDMTPGALIAYKVNGKTNVLEVIGLENVQPSDGRWGAEPVAPRLVRRYLVNASSALGEGVGQSSWVVPGDLPFGTGVENGFASVGRSQERSNPVLAVRASRQAQANGVQTMVVRGKNDAIAVTTERRLSGQSERQLKRQRVALGTGAAIMAAAAATTLIPSGGAEYHLSTSASDAVRLDGLTEVDGIPQAEQFYEADVLKRAHDAYAAYFSGDRDTLDQLRQQSGHELSWVGDKDIQRISEAASIDDVQAAFAMALGESGIQLKVYTSDGKVSVSNTGSEVVALSEAELPLIKSKVMDVLITLGKISRDKLLPVDIVLNGSMKDLGGERDNEWGLMVDGSDQSKPEIYVDVNSDGGTFGHEYIHAYDSRNGDVLTSHANQLVPTNMPNFYLGTQSSEYGGAENAINGIRVSKWSYARADPGEQAAVSGETSLNAGDATVNIDKGSVVTEEDVAVMLELERHDPGITATLLSNAETFRPSKGEAITNKIGAVVRKIQSATPAGWMALAAIAGAAGAGAAQLRLGALRRVGRKR